MRPADTAPPSHGPQATAGVRMVLLGKQGAGKGTQAKRLSNYYVVPHISTGDMFRSAARDGSAAGREVKKYLDAGELVPDDVVIDVVRLRLGSRAGHRSTSRGFILDGFPRTVPQAEALADLLGPKGLDVVIDLVVDTEVVLKRLALRRVCSVCGTNFAAGDQLKISGICDNCGGEVFQRDDDTEEAISRRLELYAAQTAPLIDWYEARGLLASIDAEGQPASVTDRIVAEVDRRKRARPKTAGATAAGSGAD